MYTEWNPILLALIASCFSWLCTALGAAVVFGFKEINQRWMDTMLGIAAGIMIAASFWSLLNPSIEMSAELNFPQWLPPSVGFISGALTLWAIDKILPHLHIHAPLSDAEGVKTNLNRSVLLVLAITLHNIPEGLAIGVAFGALSNGFGFTTFSGAVVLAFGLGIQNFLEGTAVSLPLRRDGFSVRKSFFFGQISGIVEPIAAVLGAIAVILVRPLLPFALSFAAGAMIFVVVEELIPESQADKNTDMATMGTMIGFVAMMVLAIIFE